MFASFQPFRFVSAHIATHEQALNQSSEVSDTRLRRVVARTTGVIFLGTPHRGAKIASFGRAAFRLSEILGRQRANVTLLRALERNSETIDRITTSFTETVKKDPQIRIMSFYEEKETRLSIIGERIVDPASAKLGIGEWDGIPEDHSNMARFASTQDLGFKKVSGVIKRWMGDQEKLASARREQVRYSPSYRTRRKRKRLMTARYRASRLSTKTTRRRLRKMLLPTP